METRTLLMLLSLLAFVTVSVVAPTASDRSSLSDRQGEVLCCAETAERSNAVYQGNHKFSALVSTIGRHLIKQPEVVGTSSPSVNRHLVHLGLAGRCFGLAPPIAEEFLL